MLMFHEFLKLENEVNTRDNATSDSEDAYCYQNQNYYKIQSDYYPKIGLFEGEESMLADISEDPSSFKELRDGTRASQPSSSNSNARYFSTVFYMFLMEPRGDPLGRDCAEFIVESTGVFTDKDKADSHLKAETRYINPFKKLHHRLESACPKKGWDELGDPHRDLHCMQSLDLQSFLDLESLDLSLRIGREDGSEEDVRENGGGEDGCGGGREGRSREKKKEGGEEECRRRDYLAYLYMHNHHFNFIDTYQNE
ncbi:hypothetical protein RIF29_34763 [Crotalaria pallida]|uniref:Uncharacterized protein n=1 Tax=Crotalaria pallida TaxID=3830 RepID=A0AAN9HXJ6_CROPI